MSFLRGFLSTPTEEEKQQGGFETIERLIERLETSTLLDDRRDAIRALRALSKSFQVEVGTHAMDMLINIIKEDSTDIEITEMVIETLLNVMASEGEIPPETDLGVQFTEMFVKTEDNVALLLSLLEEYEFHVRWPTVKLLSLLLKNRGKDLQERVLESPMGISKLMDLLSDSREIIRNDGLLLMIKLTKNNPSIQKIVAFENAFERLLNIVSVEGNSDGGIIVEDCLSLLLNLLRNNLSNQNFFRETSNIQRITPFFEMPAAEDEEEVPTVWSVQKQTNILLMLELLQVLINPTNNPQSVTSCQKVMYTRGIYMRLMDLLLYPGLPPDIFAKLLITIGDVIRGNEIIQQFMDELEMSERPAILLILMFMVNDKQPFKARLAALYCVQCFLFKNQKGQGRIVSTLLPNQEDVQVGVTSGQLLCAGLFSNDSVAHWLCSVTLAHCLYNNTAQHENMLQVQLELTSGLPPVHLINQVFQMLADDSNARTKFGTLMLLLHWVEECPGAVTTLLNNPPFVPYLLELVEHRDGGDAAASLMSSLGGLLMGLCLKYNDNSCPQYSKATLLHLITQRVGKEIYIELLESAVVSPLFTQATKSPHPTAPAVEELFLDFSFTKFFKKQQDIVTKALEGEDEPENSENTVESHDEIVTGYKNLIMEQDVEITRLKSLLDQASQNPGHVSDHVTQQHQQQIEQLHQYTRDQESYYQQYISQLQTWYTDQMEQLKQSQPAPSHSSPPDPQPTSDVTSSQQHLTSSQQHVTSSQQHVTSSQQHVTSSPEYEQLLAERNSLISSIEEMRQNQECVVEEHRQAVAEREERLQEVGREKQEQELYVAQLVSELEHLKLFSKEKNNQETEVLQNSNQDHLSSLNQQLSDLSTKLSLSETQSAAYREKLTESETLYQSLQQKLSESESLNASLQQKVSEMEGEVGLLKEKLSQAEGQILASESQTHGLTGLLSERESSFSLLQEKLSFSESETSILKVKLGEAESAISLLKESLDAKNSEINQLRGSSVPSSSEPVSTLSVLPIVDDNANNTAEATADKEIQRLQSQLQELQKENTELSSYKVLNETLQRDLDNLQVKLQEIQTECNDSKASSTPKLLEQEPEQPAAASQPSEPEPEQAPEPEPAPDSADTPPVVSIVTSGGTKRDYLYDYTLWFKPVLADDGVTYYQSTEGHYYTEEQYIYTMDQYEQYYRSQLPASSDKTSQQATEHATEQASEQSSEQASEQSAKQTSEQSAEQGSSEKTPEQIPNQEQSPESSTDKTSPQQVSILKEELLEARKEEERLKLEVRRLEEEVLRLQTEKTSIGKLVKSETTHHEIKSPVRVFEKSQIRQIDINGDEGVCSPTPDMSSSSTDSDLAELQEKHNAELAELQEKFDSLTSEQDDLLVLLAHQDKKIAHLKFRLRDLGDEVKSSESEDDFDDLMDSCEDLPQTDQLTGDGRLM